MNDTRKLTKPKGADPVDHNAQTVAVPDRATLPDGSIVFTPPEEHGVLIVNGDPRIDHDADEKVLWRPLSRDEQAGRGAGAARRQTREERRTLALEKLRTAREVLLRLTDPTQFADAPSSTHVGQPMDDDERRAWADYRRQLRDLPAAKRPELPQPPTRLKLLEGPQDALAAAITDLEEA